MGDDLLKEFKKIYQEREEQEIVSVTSDGKTIRCTSMEDGDCMTIVEF